ncbi:hypothetical protein FJZ33_08215, partial [Candidatus Poribacteria bacterium]|nr:hypothetical protein [Candidatus Poribacteria bacterium]
YFKITSYKNYGNDAFFWIDMDTDQNVNTGSNVFGIGTDYSVDIYLEGGNAFGSLLIYDKTQDEWYVTDATLGDVIFSPNSNILQFSLKRSDLGNPKAFDFQVVFFISMDVIDLAPDDKYYTYKLDGGQIQPGGNPSIVASPANVKPGDKITVTYTNAPGNATDWIGMYKVSAGEGRTWENHQYLNGNKNGSLTFVAPNTEGSYNFRMYPKDAYEPRLAVSNTVVVSSAAQPGGNETALQKAMAWLAKQQKADGSFCDSYKLGATAMAVQAFEEKGHLPGKGQQYSAIVEKGLDYIFSKAVLENISAQKAGNPDSNGNGKGVYFQHENKYAYETGLCISAIFASKDPNRVVNTGPCKGWTYAQVMRDVVDFFAFAQDETKGGWRYTPNQQDSDNSVAQWPVFGMLYIGQWGISAPGWVNSEVNRFIGLVQSDDGSSGYTSKTDPLDSSPWTTMGKTGGLLIEMYYLGDRANSARAQKAISYLNNKDRWNTKGKENSYAMFSIYKGLRLMDVKSLPNAVQGGDWYNDYVQLILKNQKADGYWEDYYGTCLPTAWYIMMLEDVVKPLPTVTTQNPNITLPADGQSNTGITVSVNDPQGTPLPGQTITVTINPPNGGTMGPVNDNGNGTYTGTFTAGNTPGQVTITITVININISININVTLIVPGTGTTTTVTQSPPASMPADGKSSTNITISIKNPQGQPLPGQNVTVTVNPPGAGTMGPIKDNGNGTYTGTFTAGNN